MVSKHSYYSHCILTFPGLWLLLLASCLLPRQPRYSLVPALPLYCSLSCLLYPSLLSCGSQLAIFPTPGTGTVPLLLNRYIRRRGSYILVSGIIPSKSISVEMAKTIFRANKNCIVSYDLVKISCFNRCNCPLTDLLGCFNLSFKKDSKYPPIKEEAIRSSSSDEGNVLFHEILPFVSQFDLYHFTLGTNQNLSNWHKATS